MEKVDRPLGPLVVDIAGTELTDEEIKLLQHPMVGMVILFTRNFENIDQLHNLTHDIHALRNPPLIIGVDHEGGRIQRFREGFTRIPSMNSLGQLYDKEPQRAHSLAAACGLVMAAELRACGVDFTFAPCLDLDYGQSAVIGTRSFHRNPRVVSILATELIGGMSQAGMACCGKHFPGHGYASADSHVELPVDDRPLSDIRSNDEVPYKSLGVLLTSVMPAHVAYSQVDSAPAGFSKKWLQEELRTRLGFTGLIFSDDLSMKGAAEIGEITARSDAAFAAGCDMILICNDPDGVQQVLANQRWIRTKLFDERLARILPRGKFPSRDGLELNANYKTCVEMIEAFNAELNQKAETAAAF